MGLTSSRSATVPYTAPTLVGMACILAIMTGTLVSACDSGGSNDRGSTDGLVPLQEGNQWTYSANFLEAETILEINEEGNARASTEYIYGSEAPVTILVTEQSDGLVVGVADSTGTSVVSGEDMLLKYPVEEGETYQYTDSGGDNTFEIEVERETVDVPAGTFDCLHYAIDNVDRPTTSDVWVKPGDGVVQFFVDGDSSGRVYRLQSSNVGL